MSMTKENKRRGVIRAAALVVAAVLMLTLFGCEPETAQSLIESGNELLSNYQYDKAMDKYERALELEADNLDAYIGIAKAYLGKNEYAAAADIYIQLGDKHEAGLIYEARGALDEAKELFWQSFTEAGKQESYDKYLEYTDYEVTFTDEAVEGFVREYLNKPEGVITRNELNAIEEVRIYGNDFLFSTAQTDSSEKSGIYDNYAGNKRAGAGNVKSLDDFIHFANLDYLLVYYNDLDDVPLSLAEHPKLYCLYLSYNYISDLTNVSQLDNITRLSLTANGIRNLNPLAEMTQLELLYLQKNSISDLTPLSGLANLKQLLLSQNSIRDVSPLASLVNLTDLYLDNNYYLRDVTPLSTLVNMERLVLGRTNVKDFSVIANMPNIKHDYVDLRTA